MEHADRFLRRFYIEKGMFGSLSVTFIFYRPPLPKRQVSTCLSNVKINSRLKCELRVQTAQEQRANSARTTRELRANYERELTRELRDAPLSGFSALACSHACSRRGACRGAVAITSTAISTCAGAGAGA